MPEEHGEWHVSAYTQGIEKDSSPELTYIKPGTGLFYDMRNGRPISGNISRLPSSYGARIAAS